MIRLRAAMPRDAERVRLVGRSDSEATMSVEIGGISIVTTPEFVAEDVQLLRQPPAPRPLRPAPCVWHHGSAAVLLHEAIGHPRELGMPEIEWPSWLRVDCPMAMRRASFSDVPLRRMTRVVGAPGFTVRATRAKFAAALPGARGEPLRYPGVVCSREGQELVVGSFAPLLVTRELP